MSSKAPWSIQLFGGLRVSGPGVDVQSFPTRRSGLLLARLALSRTGSVSRDDLASLLWPDDFLDSTRLRLRQELNRLRERLGPAAEIVSTDRAWVSLALAKVFVDAREFDRLLALEGAADGSKPAATHLALDLYSGQLLPEHGDDWVVAERQDYQTRYLSALVALADRQLATGDGKEALALALRAVRADPFHEPSRRAAMRAFELLGDASGALRQFSDYEKAITREFSAQPSEGLAALASSLRKSAPAKEPGVPAPAPKPAIRSHPTPLPAYFDTLVGRAGEAGRLEELLTAVPPVRLVSLTGPGGVGKTRLAVTVAAKVAMERGVPAVFVALGELEPGQSVPVKLREACGVEEAPTPEPLPGWGSKAGILVIDNVEHVLDGARLAIRDVLLNHPNLSLVVTSRHRLGLGGERELPLAPLPRPGLMGELEEVAASPAAQLFLDRARAAKPDYQVPSEQAEAFVMLLDRLDGLPLAIEIAAARAGVMSPSQMVSEIDDRFTFLVSRRADVEPRQRSLRATIDWSFRDLDPALREVLALFAAFRGGWTLDLARAATERSDVLEVLQDLSDRSLVYHDDTEYGVRFGMLETVRDYIVSEEAPADVQAARAIQAKVLAQSLFDASRKLGGSAQEEGFEAIRTELDNARAAIEWACVHEPKLGGKLGAAMWRFWCARGTPTEGALYLDRLIDAMPPEPGPEWCETLLGRGAVANVLGDPSAAALWHSRAASLAANLNLQDVESWALLNLAFAKMEDGYPEEALDAAKRALVHARPANVPLIQFVIANTMVLQGEPERAMALAEEAFAAQLTSPDPAHVGRAYHILAEIYHDAGREEGVHGLLVEAVARLRASPIQDYLVTALVALAREELRLGNLSEFEALAQEAHGLSAEIRDQRTPLLLLSLEARAKANERNLQEALDLYEAALTPGGQRPGTRLLLRVTRMLAHDLAALGKLDAAAAVLAADGGLRKSRGCGMSRPARAEVEAVERALGRPLEPVEVRTAEQLVGAVLAALAQARATSPAV